jgi:hypothetical protein
MSGEAPGQLLPLQPPIPSPAWLPHRSCMPFSCRLVKPSARLPARLGEAVPARRLAVLFDYRAAASISASMLIELSASALNFLSVSPSSSSVSWRSCACRSKPSWLAYVRTVP